MIGPSLLVSKPPTFGSSSGSFICLLVYDSGTTHGPRHDSCPTRNQVNERGRQEITSVFMGVGVKCLLLYSDRRTGSSVSSLYSKDAESKD